MTNLKAFLAIDVGGTFLKSAVLNSNGDVLKGSALSVRAFSDGRQDKIMSSFKEVIRYGLNFIETTGMKLYGIGVAFPGPFDYRNGVPLMKHKFNSIYGISLKEFFYQIPGIMPDIPVRFVHDAHAVLLGELWKGNARGFPNSAVTTLGTGLGFTFSKNGVIQSNPSGGPLISIYNMPYRDGILEDYTAQKGFMKIYNQISNKSIENVDVSDLGKWAEEGDESSLQTFQEVGRILSEALRDIIIEREIQCLLFGGQISRSFRYMENSLMHNLRDIKCLRSINAVRSIDNAPLAGTLRAILNNSQKMTGLV